jgi:hypothetical protein
MSKTSIPGEKKKNVQIPTNSLNNNSENKKRALSILDDIYTMLDRCKLDPILETFKSNEILKEFYLKRIFELMKVKIILSRMYK